MPFNDFFGSGGESRDDLEQRAARLEQENTELRTALGVAQAFDAPGAEMAEEHQRLAAQAAADPSKLPGDLYDAAVELVRRRKREAIVSLAAGSLATGTVAEIEAKVEEDEGDTLRAAEQARYAAEEEPVVRPRTERETRERIILGERERLRATRPGEIETEYEAQNGDRLRREERERYEREEAPGYREAAERRAKSRIGEAERAAMRAAIDAEADQRALQAAESEERLQARVAAIKLAASRVHMIPVTHFRADDVLTIDFCASGKAFEGGSGAESARQLRISIVSPERGIAIVLDDSWEHGDHLRAERSFLSGTLIRIGGAPSAEVAEDQPAAAIRRSVPLTIWHNDKDATPPGFEVNTVQIDMYGGKKEYLLGDNPYHRTW